MHQSGTKDSGLGSVWLGLVRLSDFQRQGQQTAMASVEVQAPPTTSGMGGGTGDESPSDPVKLVDDASLRKLICPFAVADGHSSSTATTSSSSTAAAPSWERMVKCIATHHQSVLLPPYTMTMTLYIATASVGAVIGRRGQTVAALQKSAAQVASTHQPVRVSVVAATKEHESMASNAAASGTTTTTTTGGATPTTDGTLNAMPSSTLSSTTPLASNTAAATDYHTLTPLDWSDPAWTPVVIRADAPAVCHAAQGLVELLSKAPGGSAVHNHHHHHSSHHHHHHHHHNMSATSLLMQNSHLIMDQVILDVPVARQKHSTIVGKHGQTLATFSAHSNVRIMIPPPIMMMMNHNTMPRMDLIQLEGDLFNVLACLANIMTLLVQPTSVLAAAKPTTTLNTTHATASPSTTAAAANSASSSSNNNNNNNTAVATVTTTTTASVSLPALPSQTKLRNIARKTDCQIRKQRKSNTLTVTGANADNVQTAVQLLQKWQAAQQQQQQNASSGEGGGDTAAAAAVEGGADDGPGAAASPSNNNNNNNNARSGNNNRRGGGGRGRNNAGNKRNNNNNNNNNNQGQNNNNN